jgi:hypothetical protein
MRKIVLSKEESDYLAHQLLKGHKKIFSQLTLLENGNHSVEIEMEEDTARNIRKLAGIEIHRFYFNKNKPMEKNAVLENLLDKLYKIRITVNLTKKEYNYLINNLLKDHAEILSKLTFFEDSGNSINVELEADLADDIRELASDEVGGHFDENYEPTEEGWILEHFIDKFYVE